MRKLFLALFILYPFSLWGQENQVQVHEVVNIGNTLELGLASNLIKDQGAVDLLNGWWTEEGQLSVIGKWRRFPVLFQPSFDSSDGIVRYSKDIPDHYLFRNNDSLWFMNNTGTVSQKFLLDLDNPWTADSCNTYKPKTLGTMKGVVWQEKVILFNGYWYPLVYEPILKKIDRYLGKVLEGRADTIKNGRAIVKDLNFATDELTNLFFYVDTAHSLVLDRCARIKGNRRDTIYFDDFISRTNNNLLNQKFRIFSAPAIRYIVDTFMVDAVAKAAAFDSMEIITDTIGNHIACVNNKYIYSDSTYFLEFISGSATGVTLKIANAIKELSLGRWRWKLYVLPATDTTTTATLNPRTLRTKYSYLIFSEARLDIKAGDKFIVWSQDMPKPRAAVVYKDRLWLFGDPDRSNAAFFSTPGKMNQFPVLNQLSLGQTGIWQDIVFASLFYTEGMAAPYDYLVAWKQNSAYKIFEDASGNVAVYSLFDNKGAINPNAVVKLAPGQFLFRAWDGFYITNGNDYVRVLQQLDTLGNTLTWDSVYIASYKDKVLLSFKPPNQSFKGFVWDPKTNSISETSLLFTNFSNAFFPSDPPFLFFVPSLDTGGFRKLYQFEDLSSSGYESKNFKFKTKRFDFYPGGYERWLEFDVDYHLGTGFVGDTLIIKFYRDTSSTVLQEVKYTDEGIRTKRIILNDKIVGDAISVSFEVKNAVVFSLPRFRIYYTREGRI